jgi:hypothetical protein
VLAGFLKNEWDQEKPWREKTKVRAEAMRRLRAGSENRTFKN